MQNIPLPDFSGTEAPGLLPTETPPTEAQYCANKQPAPGNSQYYPTDQSFKVTVDTNTRFLNLSGAAPYAIPNDIDGAGSAFGDTPASEPLYDEQIDGFSVMQECMADVDPFDNPCPLVLNDATREASFVAELTAFKLSILFRETFPETPQCLAI